MMIHIGICDDDPQELEKANSLLRKYDDEHPQNELKTDFFSAPLELLSYIEANGGYDVLLLDIYLPGILGTDAALELRNMGENCQMIFLTTSRDHAIDAFSLNAAHYLVKPYSEKEFIMALDKVMDNLARMKGASITVKSANGISRVDLD